MNTAIEVDHLSVRYGQTVAVNDISFHVRSGEVFALLGTNGAGKTTTLDVIEGYRRPSGGRVNVLGMDQIATMTGSRPGSASCSRRRASSRP